MSNHTAMVIILCCIAFAVLNFSVGFKLGYTQANNEAVDAVGENCINMCTSNYGCYGCQYNMTTFTHTINQSFVRWSPNGTD